MKRFLFGFLAVLFLILNTIPYLHIMADSSMTDAQYKQVGAFALSSLITSGEATELDFSDYTDSDTDFLLALGELVVSGDPTSLIDCGLDWLGGEIDDIYHSAIQSIREWEYNMSPTLYYWFVDTQPPYELSSTYNSIRDLSQPLRRLLTPPNDSSPTPSPDPDFSYILTDNDWYIGSNATVKYISSGAYTSLHDNITDSSNYWMSSSLACEYTFFSKNNITSNGEIWTSTFCISPLTTIYIDTSNGCHVTYSNFSNVYRYYNTQNVYGVTLYNRNPDTLQNGDLRWSIYFQNAVNQNFNPQTSFAGLSTAINYLHSHFRHYNLYVNNVLWLSSNLTPTYPIVIPDQLTIWNDQPLQYEFPSDTYLKLPDLTTIISNAINNSGVVMWSDIADCFVDINGQTAVAVTKIVRNDYDNLYMEQYPFPAMLVGMTDQTKFNEHLLDNSHAYLSPIGTVVQETVNILPSELVGVLAIGCILTIFAVIINRLLE